MFYALLEGESKQPTQYLTYILIGVLVVVLVVSMILMNRRSKKREQEAQALINAVKPGNKVKTIGGICGIVVEVNPEEDTFVLETGSEESGKSYMKFVRQAILESDAVVEKATPAASEKVEEAEVKEEAQPETEKTEEAPAEAPAAEEKTEDKADKE